MRLTPTSLLAAGALALGLGCAPSNPGLVAQGALSADTMCLVTATNALLIEGMFDLQTDVPANYRPRGMSYAIAYQVGNQLINNANRVYPLMADPNRIVINNAEITLLDASESPLSLPGLPNPYLVTASGAIGSTQSMDPTLGIATATVIPDSYGRALAGVYAPGGTVGAGATIVVQARIIGTTAGGATLTSGPVVFPVSLCVGCLFQPACDTMHNPIFMPSCEPGQDAVTGVPTGC